MTYLLPCRRSLRALNARDADVNLHQLLKPIAERNMRKAQNDARRADQHFFTAARDVTLILIHHPGLPVQSVFYGST